VVVNVDDQDEMLDEIGRGLEELKQLGLDMGQNLTVQNAKLGEIDEKMEDTLFQMESAHTRLQDVLAQSGGLTRWCPLIVCIVFLLALVMFIINMVTDGPNKRNGRNG
jgi:t-SNARE complex subunit (syntaxin)